MKTIFLDLKLNYYHFYWLLEVEMSYSCELFSTLFLFIWFKIAVWYVELWYRLIIQCFLRVWIFLIYRPLFRNPWFDYFWIQDILLEHVIEIIICIWTLGKLGVHLNRGWAWLFELPVHSISRHMRCLSHVITRPTTKPTKIRPIYLRICSWLCTFLQDVLEG